MVYLFIIFVWMYFMGEGVTEGFTWRDLTYIMSPDEYHIWRLVENLGVLGAVYCYGVLEHYHWIFYTLTILSGLSVYEMAYNVTRYKKLLYNKTSKWFFIPHPPGWFWLALFIISTAVLAVII